MADAGLGALPPRAPRWGQIATRLTLFLAGLWVPGGGHAAESLAARVIILANADDPDSLRIARHYASARNVPVENIVAKKMALTETISWREFVATIWQPVRDELVNRQWIDAIPIAIVDGIGRKKYAVNGHRIGAIVVCRGVPLKIAHEPDFYAENPPLTQRKEFRSNAGAVDSELSMLVWPSYNINAFIANPLYQNSAPSELERAQVIPVGRLDGPSADDALALVDRALEVEHTGLIGRAYVDIGGIHAEGDRWFESVATQLAMLGFDSAVDRAPATMPATARCDEPVLYFGWYATDLNGPFALPGFQFPAGAVALHIHSYSAGTLRSSTSGWTAPLVARGVTATVGNVYEPYLQFTHRPDLLLRALARGATLGEAAIYALPALSWQTVLVGDPLYRPFAVPFEEQWKNRAGLPPRLASYLVLRRMHLLETSGKATEALSLLRTAQQEAPGLPVGVALAQRLHAAEDSAGVVRALEFSAGVKNFRPEEWALAREAAQLLAGNGGAANAVEIYRTLFAIKSLPVELRAAWLAEAARAALAAQNRPQSAAWEKDLADLGAPPAEAKK